MNHIKKYQRILIASIVLAAMLPQSILAAPPAPAVDESVYVNLDYYGVKTDMSVVKGVSLNGVQEFTDYGSYSNVINMSNYAVPAVTEDGVTWKLDGSEDRFYFQGNPVNEIELPWNIDVDYKLDGVPAAAEKLAGASGLVEIHIKVTPNPNTEEYYKNNMLLQAAVMVDMEDTKSIDAPGAQLQAMGNIKAVIFAALPGEETDFVIRLGTDSFETSGIIFMMIPGTLEQMKDIKKLKEAKDKVKDAADDAKIALDDIITTLEEMESGLSATKSGLASMEKARQIISSGKGSVYQSADEALEVLSQAAQDVSNLTPHMTNAQGLVTQANEDVNKIVDTLQKTKEHLTQYRMNITKLTQDTNAFIEALDDIQDMTEERRDVFQEMKDSLKKMGTSLDDLRGDTRSMATELGNLNSTMDDLKTIAWRSEDIVNEVSNAISYILSSGVVPGGAASQLAYPLTTMSDNIKTNVRDIGYNANETIEKTSQFMTATEQALKDLKDTLEGTAALTDSLQSGVDLADQYFAILEDKTDEAQDVLKQLQSAGETAKKSLDNAALLINQATALNDTVNGYIEDTVALLQDTAKLTETLSQGIQYSTEFLTGLKTLMQESGKEIDTGTQEALAGMMDVLSEGITGIGRTDSLKTANNTIKDTIDDELDKFEEENQFLYLDSELPAVSFTSAKNAAPETLQVILRTQEISIDSNEPDNPDYEQTAAPKSVWQRIADVFVKLWNAITGVFTEE